MKVLFICPLMPYPLDSALRIRVNLLSRYISRNHKLYLAFPIESEEEQNHVIHLKPYCEEVVFASRKTALKSYKYALQSIITGKSYHLLNTHLPVLQSRIEELVERVRPDVVHVHLWYMAQYATETTGAYRVLDPTVVPTVEIGRMLERERWGPIKLLTALELPKVARCVTKLGKEFDRVVAISPIDKTGWDKLVDNPKKVWYIPHGLDLENIPLVERTPGSQNILFVGSMFYRSNGDGVKWFAEEVFPRVKKQLPGSRFFIVGARPWPDVVRLGEKDKSVIVTGYVRDLDPYIRQSAVLVCPIMWGSGVRLKIFDAWAQGIPVVSTTLGAEGIECVPGEHLLIADRPDEFAEKVVRVIRDKELARRLVVNGRRWVEEKYDWRVVYTAYDRLYEDLLTVKSADSRGDN